MRSSSIFTASTSPRASPCLSLCAILKRCFLVLLYLMYSSLISFYYITRVGSYFIFLYTNTILRVISKKRKGHNFHSNFLSRDPNLGAASSPINSTIRLSICVLLFFLSYHNGHLTISTPSIWQVF